MCALKTKNLITQNTKTTTSTLPDLSSRVATTTNMKLSILTTLVLLLSTLHSSLAQSCVPDGPCRCVMSDGTGAIDISTLGNQDGTPRFSDVLDPYGASFAVNPCFNFDMDGCKGVGVCKKPALIGSQYENYGNAETAVMSYNGFNAVMSLTGELGKKSEIMLLCQDTQEFPQLDAIGEMVWDTPSFLLSTKCACPGACESAFPQDGDTGGLTAGSILLITCFVLVLVYLLGGIAFNKVTRQATGVEVMPHPEFWKGLPGLIKDGMVFSWGKMTGKSRSSGYESV